MKRPRQKTPPAVIARVLEALKPGLAELGEAAKGGVVELLRGTIASGPDAGQIRDSVFRVPRELSGEFWMSDAELSILLSATTPIVYIFEGYFGVIALGVEGSPS